MSMTLLSPSSPSRRTGPVSSTSPVSTSVTRPGLPTDTGMVVVDDVDVEELVDVVLVEVDDVDVVVVLDEVVGGAVVVATDDVVTVDEATASDSSSDPPPAKTNSTTIAATATRVTDPTIRIGQRGAGSSRRG